MAKESARDAEAAVETSPHDAAFHAQLCTERAIKAAAFEFGPFATEKEFDSVARRVGHNSTMACLPVIEASVMLGIDREMAAQDRLVEDNPGVGIAVKSAASLAAVYSRRVARKFAKSAFEQMETSMRRAWSRKGNWKRSLDLAFDPTAKKGPAGKEIELDRGTKSLFWMYRRLLSSMGVSDKDAYRVEESKPGDQPFKAFDALVADLKSKGQKDVLIGIERSLTSVEGAVGPNRELFDWVGFVAAWSPYLDAHAVSGRYPTTEQLAYYKSHVEGVRRLVKVAAEILDKTVAILPIAMSFAGG